MLFLAELGEYDPKEHTMGYVSEFRFIPNQVWIIILLLPEVAKVKFQQNL